MKTFKNVFHIYDYRCSWIVGDDCEIKKFTQADQDKMITDLIEPMANDALRTICIAYKDYVPSNIHCVSKKTGPLLPFAITPTVLLQ